MMLVVHFTTNEKMATLAEKKGVVAGDFVDNMLSDMFSNSPNPTYPDTDNVKVVSAIQPQEGRIETAPSPPTCP